MAGSVNLFIESESYKLLSGQIAKVSGNMATLAVELFVVTGTQRAASTVLSSVSIQALLHQSEL